MSMRDCGLLACFAVLQLCGSPDVPIDGTGLPRLHAHAGGGAGQLRTLDREGKRPELNRRLENNI